MAIRQPIVSILGHVDHGKTSLLDFIRSSTVASREAGGITQHIGATSVPIKFIKAHCAEILKKWKIDVSIPGLLFIDTPGHHAFTTLRKRGGALSDIAVLIVDVNDGFQPQTIEAIDILKQHKTPFVVAMNKIDMLHDWKPAPTTCILDSVPQQKTEVATSLDTKLYELVGTLFEHGYESERYDRVEDFTKQICIVPVSAKTGEGVGDLLVILTGLCQQFLEKNLHVSENIGKGSVLEVKEERGLGKTIDIILYDGVMRRGDTIVVGTLDEPLITKVRALLQPKDLDEIRDPRERFNNVKEISAAAGIKISAPKLEGSIAGVPVIVANDKKTQGEAIDTIKSEISSLLIESEEDGVILRADTLGSLEALVFTLKSENIPIKRANVGSITRRDLIDADQTGTKNPYLGVVLAFNVKPTSDVVTEADRLKVDVFSDPVIYKLIENYQEWVEKKRAEEKKRILSSVTRPAKFEVLRGYVFRQSNPAVVGVEILGGILKPGIHLMTRDGTTVGQIKELQDKSENVKEAVEKQQVAVSISGAKVGKDFDEGDILFADIPENDFKIIKNVIDVIEGSEKAALNEIIDIKRGKYPLWGKGR